MDWLHGARRVRHARHMSLCLPCEATRLLARPSQCLPPAAAWPVVRLVTAQVCFVLGMKENSGVYQLSAGNVRYIGRTAGTRGRTDASGGVQRFWEHVVGMHAKQGSERDG
eukprot:15464422-Alexandrium_andersonii.AAC.1